jgi:cell division protein FtsZ
MAEAAPAPVRAEPRAEYRAPEPAPAPEPTLFDERFEGDYVEDTYNRFEAPVHDADLPPPAYRPRADVRPESRPDPRAETRPETRAEAFVAPGRPAPGTPTPEALARLRNAVNRAPTAPAVPAPRAPEPRSVDPRAPEAERPRFGLNNLINRMTGQQGGEASAPAARQQPQVTAPREEAAHDPDQERIDIPAFLRRQAN